MCLARANSFSADETLKFQKNVFCKKIVTVKTFSITLILKREQNSILLMYRLYISLENN